MDEKILLSYLEEYKIKNLKLPFNIMFTFDFSDEKLPFIIHFTIGKEIRFSIIRRDKNSSKVLLRFDGNTFALSPDANQFADDIYYIFRRVCEYINRKSDIIQMMLINIEKEIDKLFEEMEEVV